MLLCNTKLSRGEKKGFKLPVPGANPRRGVLVCGACPGKTLAVTAGVHGCEYPGIEAVRAICREVDPQTLHGQLILLPVLNESGFYAGSRQIVPGDGVNLNRAFPGNPEGTEAYRIAAAVERMVYPEADFLVDLHSGDINEMATPFLFFPAASCELVAEQAREAAKSISVPFRVASSAKNGLYSRAAQCGIPSLLLERSGQGLRAPEDVKAYKENIYELMAHLGMTDGETARAGGQREIRKADYLEAPCEGLWYPCVTEGQRMKHGQLLGELRDMDDNVIQRFKARFDGIVLYYTLSLGVGKGEPLAAYGEIDEE